MYEELNQAWAKKMSDLLLEMREFVKEQTAVIPDLTNKELQKLLTRYQEILTEGYMSNPEPPVRTGKRGQAKKTKAQNLLERLNHYQRNALAFLYDFRIPFTNNQAEQDIRMIKVQQKI